MDFTLGPEREDWPSVPDEDDAVAFLDQPNCCECGAIGDEARLRPTCAECCFPKVPGYSDCLRCVRSTLTVVMCEECRKEDN